ncbi:hypothetical protein NU08_0947 [Flavobacterium anhuiense]|uniref:Uncharacterized protein n=1 Tax=Flavobacterium anhuiense TaxID=459526 RepID=A0A444W2S0_9FLAO|nr:hypothetical protein NU08_0947 [Flavobacterium anhuiense]
MDDILKNNFIFFIKTLAEMKFCYIFATAITQRFGSSVG